MMQDGMTGNRKLSSARRILSDKGKSSYEKYRELTTGDAPFLRFLLYELLAIILVPFPGALGIFLRRIVYKNRFFRGCGKGLIVGRNCIFRHPSKITIGNNVTVDDNCLVDARGTEGGGIVLEDGAIINRNSIVQSKGGDILIGKNVAIGSNSSLVSWSGLKIDEGSILAGGCYVSAGKFDYTDLETSVLDQETYSSGPIEIGRNVWIATRVTILDGVQIGKDSIISAGSVITGVIPPRSIAAGNPAKVVFQRR